MEKSPKKLKKKYRIIQYSCFISEFVAVAIPFVAIALVNYDKYFIEYSGVKMSISFFMAMAVLGFAVWGISSEKIKNTYIALIIKWAIIAFIFTMLGQIINDIATIMWFGLIGICASFGLDIGSKKAKQKKNEIIDAEKQANKEDMVEAVKEEKKIKVKVTKK